MQIIKSFIFFPFRKIKFAMSKHGRIGRNRKLFLCFFGSLRWKLREETEPSLADRLAHITVSHVREKYEGFGCAKLLALKKQRCPWPKQEQGGHRAITSRRGLAPQPFAVRRIRDMIVIFKKPDKSLRRQFKCWHAPL